jgi:hypothetical protein
MEDAGCVMDRITLAGDVIHRDHRPTEWGRDPAYSSDDAPWGRLMLDIPTSTNPTSQTFYPHLIQIEFPGPKRYHPGIVNPGTYPLVELSMARIKISTPGRCTT